MLLRHLPRDSAVARELHGEAAEWSVSDYLLAAAVDQLAEANWMFATVNQDEHADALEYPVPVRRPGKVDTGDEDAGPGQTSEEGREMPDSTVLHRFFG
ncbi:hypothetical protein [Streptomyces cyaneofuscatus]|uniref:hypothetical protein n=1 Tax=Streptomyces cyaneofuscatus TaxID=66883 RepID=UPI0037FEC938